MRTLSILALAFVSACGSTGGPKVDSGPGQDGTSQIDAPPSADAAPPVAITGTVTDNSGMTTVPLVGATIEVVGASPANQTTSDAMGKYTLMVGPGQTVFLRASKSGFLAEQRGLVVGGATSAFDLQPVPMSRVNMAAAQLAITFDPAKGFVVTKFAMTNGGYGATLSAAHDNSFDCGNTGCAFSNTTQGNNSDLIFPNVVAGTTTATPTAPTGHTCTAEQAITDYRVDANTLTRISFTCT